MIVVYGIKGKLDPITAELSDLIHGCMQSVLGLPEDKRDHRFQPPLSLEKDDFYSPGDRSEAYTVIETNMVSGREPDTQKKLIKALFQANETHLSIAPVDVENTIEEQAPYQWGCRGVTGDEAKGLKYIINA